MNKPTSFQQELDTMERERKVQQRSQGPRNANAERDHEYRMALLDHEYRLAVLDHEYRMRKLEVDTSCQDLQKGGTELPVEETDEYELSIEEAEEMEREREQDSEIETIDGIDPDDLDDITVLRPAKPRRKLESAGAAIARNNWAKDRSHLETPKQTATTKPKLMRAKPKAKRD